MLSRLGLSDWGNAHSKLSIFSSLLRKQKLWRILSIHLQRLRVWRKKKMILWPWCVLFRWSVWFSRCSSKAKLTLCWGSLAELVLSNWARVGMCEVLVSFIHCSSPKDAVFEMKNEKVLQELELIYAEVLNTKGCVLSSFSFLKDRRWPHH
jgi:hypothetical protein